jgi:hypothetical protein
MSDTELATSFEELLVLTRKPILPELVAATRAYYALPGNAVGGSLHIVLDDLNLGTSSIEWCQAYAAEKGDLAGIGLARMLLLASPTQRRKLVNTFWRT